MLAGIIRYREARKTLRGAWKNNMSRTAVIGDVISGTDVVKRAARIGAEVKNIKLSGDLPDHTIDAINSLLLEHKVIFFRNQGHLNDAEHERFAARLGKLGSRLN